MLTDAEVVEVFGIIRKTLDIPSPDDDEAFLSRSKAALDAAIERFQPIPPGALAEAVGRLESAILMAESPPGSTVTTRDVLAGDIRLLIQAVQQQAQQPDSVPVVQQLRVPDPDSTSGYRVEHVLGAQAQQPEADPELVNRYRFRRAWQLETELQSREKIIRVATAEAAAIRQVLREKGETDGQAR